MKRLFILACIIGNLSASSKAQSSPKPGYFTKIPIAIKNCGAMYTYDTIALAKKKYILLTDFQNLGLLMIGEKQVRLQLTDSKTVDKVNISTYLGEGYTVVLSYETIQQGVKSDMEKGALQITKGTKMTSYKIHGESHCDESTGK